MRVVSWGPRFNFFAKVVAALVLAIVANQFFFIQHIGATLGLFALLWALQVGLTRPTIIRHRRALIAFLAAALFALGLIDDPSPLGWFLFWIALSLATLLPNFRCFDNAWLWAGRLALHALTAAIALFADARRLLLLRPGTSTTRLKAVAPILALPLAGSAAFLFLFANANPLIASAIAAIRLPELDFETMFRIAFSIFVAMGVWPMFRPRRATTTLPRPSALDEGPLPGVSVASVTLSLILFNAMFAIQNALDIIFLWSGAPLPQTMTLAEYAHRGAYPLIVTALLAGLFVLVTLRPGSKTAKRPLIRQLVVVWVGQNILLVASSILRTLDYVDVYSLTRLRIAALAWMVLVAIGLMLICWRLLRNRTGAWLINSCAAAAGITLTLFSMIDLGAASASWNVVHAREAGGRGEPLDLCYLQRLGPPALLPLTWLERRRLEPRFRDRVTAVRAELLGDLERRQADWHGWTLRGARRLATARTALGDHPRRSRPVLYGRSCGGVPISPPRVAPIVFPVEAPPPPASAIVPPPLKPPLTGEGRQ